MKIYFYPTVCVKKTFPLSFNTIPFGFVKFSQKPNGNHAQRRSISFHFILVWFRSVSFRSVSCAESKSRLFPVGDSQARWSTLCFPQTHFRAFGRLHATRRSLGTRFSKVGVAPRSLIARAFDDLCWHGTVEGA